MRIRITPNTDTFYAVNAFAAQVFSDSVVFFCCFFFSFIFPLSTQRCSYHVIVSIDSRETIFNIPSSGVIAAPMKACINSLCRWETGVF